MAQYKMKHLRRWIWLAGIVSVVLSSLMVPQTAWAKNPNPALTVRWWEWAFSEPSPDDPLSDTSGDNCDVNQSGDIWFLAGTVFTNPIVERTCTIPAGKYLFFPVINVVYVGYPTVPEDTPDFVKKAATGYMDSVLAITELNVELDGVAIPIGKKNRVGSPIFALTLPSPNAYGITENECPGFACWPNAADGIYVMLDPLAPGEHTLHFSASGFLDITYTLIVEGEDASAISGLTAPGADVPLFLPLVTN